MVIFRAFEFIVPPIFLIAYRSGSLHACDRLCFFWSKLCSRSAIKRSGVGSDETRFTSEQVRHCTRDGHQHTTLRSELPAVRRALQIAGDFLLTQAAVNLITIVDICPNEGVAQLLLRQRSAGNFELREDEDRDRPVEGHWPRTKIASSSDSDTNAAPTVSRAVKPRASGRR